MPDVRESDEEHDVLAVLCSDIHFCHKKPSARSPEPDWYLAMVNPCEQLANIANQYDVPVVIAGDLFDRWNAPAELVNFAIVQLRRIKNPIFTIPGQHDLPNHNYDDIKRSAYWTLVEAQVINHLPASAPTLAHGMSLHAFPWSYDVTPLRSKSSFVSLAVCHSYIHTSKTGYKGASESLLVNSYRKKLKGYDAAVFGDNHIGFLSGTVRGRKNLLNCGSFMVRKVDEIGRQPVVGLLHSNGNISRVELDTSLDQYVDVDASIELVEMALNMTDFVGALGALGQDSLSFFDQVKQFLETNDISTAVRKRVMEAVENAKDHLR